MKSSLKRVFDELSSSESDEESSELSSTELEEDSYESSSYESDEESSEILVRNSKKMRKRGADYEDMDEELYRARFRLSKATVNTILEEIRHATVQQETISPMNQLLLTLRFYATGSYLISAGDFCGVSVDSAHRIIHRITEAIAYLRPKKVKFPTTEGEISNFQTQFYEIARLPRVIGCIDCTHVRVQSFGGENAEAFRNRKGHFSINVQAVCNANLEFTDIVARWPGSVHDKTIFNNSRICAMFESGKYGDAVLLGDTGYTMRPYVMTPLRNPQTEAEQLYNESQIKTRSIIEQVFRIWKTRFPILEIGCQLQKPEKVLAVIVATVVLHNIARQFSDPEPPSDPVIPTELSQSGDNTTLPGGAARSTV